ncbi:PREDICTED: pentatricopeptide repeat-containing protein At3g13880-like [Tarenaya hassleriana]|uniref:pentatricopeptide repeat-containing protein At3g13880-like n=1 Tax=Tarenaya hassleriana TaxID=28532 RepID=UPI0008FD5DF3|nr:PREDICTED: pentatricopeptide repeat-containing protein At3g13880-like [Tarenaya hassleriana]
MLLIFRTKILSNKNCAASCTTHLSERFGTSCEASPSPCGPKSTALDSVTYTKLVQTAAKSGSMVLGKLAHARMIKTSFNPCLFLLNNMLNMYSKCGELGFARYLLDGMPQRNIISFNSLISGYTQMGYHDRVFPITLFFNQSLMSTITDESVIETFELFMEMQRRGLKPSASTLSTMLKACNVVKALEYGKQIHALVCKNNFQADEFIGSALIELYALLGSTEDGMKCFGSTSRRDIASWTSMIDCFIQNEQFESACDLFCQLFLSGVKPEEFTVSLMLSACADFAASRMGEQLQGYAIRSGIDNFTCVKTSTICMYAKSGNMQFANKSFREVVNPDIATYSAMICSLAQHGLGNDALDLFKSMPNHGLKPNHQTFLGVLIACTHGGLITEGLKLFEGMKKDYGINPDEKHFSCIVDLLGRAGRLSEAENLILRSGFQDHPVMWRALLSSCRVYKNSVIGKRVAERLIDLEPDASGTYVLLYNIYNEAGIESSAEEVRELMRGRGVKKEPGMSWIEIGSELHSFMVGDWSHGSSQMIYTSLERLFENMNSTGFEDETSVYAYSLT